MKFTKPIRQYMDIVRDAGVTILAAEQKGHVKLHCEYVGNQFTMDIPTSPGRSPQHMKNFRVRVKRRLQKVRGRNGNDARG